MTTQSEERAAAVIERVKRLLALAGNNPNEHEAASASAMAQKLMEDHNIDMAVLGKSGKGTQGARSDQKQKGGLYGWQRDLWKASAELNMCVYWSLKGLERGSVYEHRVLGSQVNVLSTTILAEYLQGTIDRIAQGWAKERGYKSPFVREAIALREGIASRLVERLREQRRQRIAEDERKAREAKATASHPSAAPGTGIVLADVIQSEDDLNQDHIKGWEPGTTAAKRAEYKMREYAAQVEADAWKSGDRAAFVATYGAARAAERERWDAIDAKREADYKLYAAGKKSDTYGAGYRERKSTSAGPRAKAKTAAEERAELWSFREGRHMAEDIGLDKQIDEETPEQLA